MTVPSYVRTLAVFALASVLLGAGSWQGNTYKINASDREILDRIQFRSFLYFWEQAGRTGIIRDRAPADGSPEPATAKIGSIAATGFGLTAICIGEERKWITREQAVSRVRTTLEFLANDAPVVHGWFYHYMDPDTGKRVWNSEISSIDTALLLAGVIFAGEKYSDDARIASLASFIYARVDFPWMLNGDPHLFSHGWTPKPASSVIAGTRTAN